MHIEITDHTTIREIQEAFANFYPYLQIEFYKKPHKKYQASAEKDLVYPGKTIDEIKQTHVSGLLEISPASKVADVEKEFLQRFGLSVQVLRKQKNGWEQTTGMDDFTLKELNEMGRNSSASFIMEDYDEGFEEKEEKPSKLY
jgi:glycerol-3-phosphate O-acyltransferase